MNHPERIYLADSPGGRGGAAEFIRGDIVEAIRQRFRDAEDARMALEAKVKRFQALMEAAAAFLAEPPKDMLDSEGFNQDTTAGDCRALNKAYREAAEAARGK